jgi:hypothetical protein
MGVSEKLRQHLQNGQRQRHFKNLLDANQQVGLQEMLADSDRSNSPFP